MFLGKNGLIWYLGVVEDRNDPAKLGRCRIRMHGIHTEDKGELPTQDLMWCLPSFGVNNTSQKTTLKEGDWVWGFFLDDNGLQKPVVVGTFPGIPQEPADPEKGFNDPTTDLSPTGRPTIPEMMPLSSTEPSINVTEIRNVIKDLQPAEDVNSAINRCVDIIFEGKNSIPVSELSSAISRIPDATSQLSGEIQSSIQKGIDWLTTNLASITSAFSLDKLFNEASKFLDKFSGDTLPGSSSAFGELMKGWDISKSKFDRNKDGQFTAEDAEIMIEEVLSPSGFFTGESSSVAGTLEPSSYPHKDKLNEPSIPRLARNENIEKTIVGRKLANLSGGIGAGHAAQDKGAQSDEFNFQEPPTAYNAVYPYNNVHESESGHVIEIDDSPGAERLHWFHRTGTFREIHPDGKEVNKIIKEQYNFVLSDYFLGVSKSINVHSKDAIRLKSQSDTNMEVGSNLNAEVSSNVHIGVGDGIYMYAKGGVVFIKGAKAISLQSDGDVDLISGKAIHLKAPEIHLDGVLNAQNPPYNSPQGPSIENDADKKTESTDSSPKPGFLWASGLPGEVYKPASDSDGKLVTLSPSPEPHQLYEAIPTGVLEGAEIRYENADGSIKTWQVVRPVHVSGKLIDTPVKIQQFEDGVRFLQRWSQAGAKYPPQMFLKTGGGMKLIIDSSTRHHFKAPFAEKIAITT